MSRSSNNRLIESHLKQIDTIFRAHLNEEPHVVNILDIKIDKKCDLHGKTTPSRRGSVEFIKSPSRKGSMLLNSPDSDKPFCSTEKLNGKLKNSYRNSITSFAELTDRSSSVEKNDTVNRNSERRKSMPILDVVPRKNSLYMSSNRLSKHLDHPSNFPNILRSFDSSSKKNQNNRRSSNWNVNQFHNYNGLEDKTNLDRKQSLSVSEKIYKRDYSSPEPKRESSPTHLHSILKQKRATDDYELKEIIKRLSFDYIENEMSKSVNKMDSDSSSGDNGRTSSKLIPRRISIDSLESSSRRSSRRFSDYSVNSDDLVVVKPRANKTLLQVSLG